MDDNKAEIYANTYHYVCVICEKNFSRDEVREIKSGDFTKFICDGCHSKEINAGLFDYMMSPIKGDEK